MATWTLADIRYKVRKVTGRYSSTELSTAELDNYINGYYQFTFPAEVKLDKKFTYYTFQTIENQPFYDAPDTTYTNYVPTATANNLDLLWYQNPGKFFEENPEEYSFLMPWTGDGSTTNFTTTLSTTPMYPATLTISDGIESFQDTNQTFSNSPVTIAGSQGGTCSVNYSTGAISVIFNSAPTNGSTINLNYVPFQAGRPRAILYYNNQFQMYPVPDQVYLIKMQAWLIVTPLVNASDMPDLQEWGPAIAYGAAKSIFTDYGELDAYAETDVLYQRQIDYILTRTCQNLLNTRSLPNF